MKITIEKSEVVTLEELPVGAFFVTLNSIGNSKGSYVRQKTGTNVPPYEDSVPTRHMSTGKPGYAGPEEEVQQLFLSPEHFDAQP